MTPFESSLDRAQNGNPKIDTPQAASDLNYILHKQYKITNGTGLIQIRKVEYGLIEFRVKVVIFKFIYKPAREFGLFYRHMESERWNNAHFNHKFKDKVKHLVNLVSKYAFKDIPSPIED